MPFNFLSFLWNTNLNAQLAGFCQPMSNHCERISSTARFSDSTLTFDFREASPTSPQFTTTNGFFFIINAVVLELLKAYGVWLCLWFLACGQGTTIVMHGNVAAPSSTWSFVVDVLEKVSCEFIFGNVLGNYELKDIFLSRSQTSNVNDPLGLEKTVAWNLDCKL